MNFLKLSLLVFAFVGVSASAKTLAPDVATKQIEEAIVALQPLAYSGIQDYQLKEPEWNVKKALLALALQEEYISEESEFSWEGFNSAAWYADSTNWGESTMKEAFSYTTMLDQNQDMTKEQRAREIAAAKKAFNLLQNTGVQFGVAPLGAVQCGVTFAGLAIINPHNGKIYVFAREGSGC